MTFIYVLIVSIQKFLQVWVVAGTEIVTALGSEVDRLEQEIQNLVPGIKHVDIEAHNPT